MDRRTVLLSAMPVLGLVGISSGDAITPKPDSIQVEVDGLLGVLVRQEGTTQVSASILAGGGELFLDTSRSKEAHQVLVRLADKYLKAGSSTFVPPRLKIKGRMEYRNSQKRGEEKKDSPKPGAWFILPESLKVLEFGEK